MKGVKNMPQRLARVENPERNFFIFFGWHAALFNYEKIGKEQ